MLEVDRRGLGDLLGGGLRGVAEVPIVAALELREVPQPAKGDFDRVVLNAASPEAVEACRRAVEDQGRTASPEVALLTWLDVS